MQLKPSQHNLAFKWCGLYTQPNEKDSRLLAPAIHYANKIPLLAAVSAFILIFKERERQEEGKKMFFW